MTIKRVFSGGMSPHQYWLDVNSRSFRPLSKSREGFLHYIALVMGDFLRGILTEEEYDKYVWYFDEREFS